MAVAMTPAGGVCGGGDDANSRWRWRHGRWWRCWCYCLWDMAAVVAVASWEVLAVLVAVALVGVAGNPASIEIPRLNRRSGTGKQLQRQICWMQSGCVHLFFQNCHVFASFFVRFEAQVD